VTGSYAYARHPQIGGFIFIMLGFLLQWATLITLIMFSILVTMYVRLARCEEREILSEYGDEYHCYAARTPAFLARSTRMIDKPGMTLALLRFHRSN
jgi:methanethiol S-methyltransferase